MLLLYYEICLCSPPFKNFLNFFQKNFFTFEVVFENCKCRSWCRPDDLVSSYTKSSTVLMYFGLILMCYE